jgi:hypothetical protein
MHMLRVPAVSPSASERQVIYCEQANNFSAYHLYNVHDVDVILAGWVWIGWNAAKETTYQLKICLAELKIIPPQTARFDRGAFQTQFRFRSNSSVSSKLPRKYTDTSFFPIQMRVTMVVSSSVSEKGKRVVVTLFLFPEPHYWNKNEITRNWDTSSFLIKSFYKLQSRVLDVTYYTWLSISIFTYLRGTERNCIIQFNSIQFIYLQT